MVSAAGPAAGRPLACGATRAQKTNNKRAAGDGEGSANKYEFNTSFFMHVQDERGGRGRRQGGGAEGAIAPTKSATLNSGK